MRCQRDRTDGVCPICPGAVYKATTTIQTPPCSDFSCSTPIRISYPVTLVPICPYPDAGDTHLATRGLVPGCGSNPGRCPGKPPAAAAATAAAAAAARAAATLLTSAPSGTWVAPTGGHSCASRAGLGCRRQKQPAPFTRTTSPPEPWR